MIGLIIMGIAGPLGVILTSEETDLDEPGKDIKLDEEDLEDSSEITDSQTEEPTDESEEESNDSDVGLSDDDEAETTSEESRSEDQDEDEELSLLGNTNEEIDEPSSSVIEYDLVPYDSPYTDDKKQNEYDDRSDPDPSSDKLRTAIEWIINAHTEAIHQQKEREKFLRALRHFIRDPRAFGAEEVAKTEWRDLSPNLSRLIGERFLIIALGLSAYGNIDMDGHLKAFTALMGNSWANDELEQPLFHQCLGRLGFLTDTTIESLNDKLKSKVPGRVLRDPEPSILEQIRLNSLLLAVGVSGRYPFPRSEKGLSRLWHWDEHNPPLVEPEHLKPILHTLWTYNVVNENQSEIANDFGAMLGTWWDDKEPDTEFFESNADVWKAILLTGWVLLGEEQIIWDQLQERYQELDFDDESLVSVSESYFDWIDTLRRSPAVPEDAPRRDSLPPMDWIRPLASDGLRDHSEPSFDYPKSWCNQLTSRTEPEPNELDI